LGKGSKWW